MNIISKLLKFMFRKSCRARLTIYGLRFLSKKDFQSVIAWMENEIVELKRRDRDTYSYRFVSKLFLD